MKRNFPEIIAFVGYSGSGKTTLLTKVISILSGKNYKVGTIKHTHHNFEIDKPGKDSYLHFHSGAFASMIVSDEKIAFVKRCSEQNISEIVTKYYSDCDVVLIEGFKDYDTPKILVHRKELGKQLLYDKLSNVIAIATDAELDISIPVFNINKPEIIAAFIEEKFLK